MKNHPDPFTQALRRVQLARAELVTSARQLAQDFEQAVRLAEADLVRIRRARLRYSKSSKGFATVQAWSRFLSDLDSQEREIERRHAVAARQASAQRTWLGERALAMRAATPVVPMTDPWDLDEV